MYWVVRAIAAAFKPKASLFAENLCLRQHLLILQRRHPRPRLGIRSAASSLADVRAEAQRAGIATGVFQELSFAAEQSSIKVDAVVQGMRELQRRADEFISTSAGRAAEAFERIGLSSSELRSRLQDPADLLTDIVRRVQHLDKASQIRIFDQIFGGTAGQQFVRFLEGGADALEELRKRAHETGNVLDEDILKRAEQIDQKFNEITRTVGTKLKGALVEAVGALMDFWGAVTPSLPSTLEAVEARIREIRDLMRETTSPGRLQILDVELQRLQARRAQMQARQPTEPSQPATVAVPPRPVPRDLQREFDQFIQAGAEARLSAYAKAVKGVEDAYAELAKKVRDAGLAQDKEREMLHLLEVAREAQTMAIKDKSEAEELAIAKVERAQQAMRDELAIL